jgi:hypothetical protein
LSHQSAGDLSDFYPCFPIVCRERQRSLCGDRCSAGEPALEIA